MAACIWFTGLSGAGKSTLGAVLAERLRARGETAYVLDGDRLRAGLNKDLGFSAEDRQENVRRVSEVARLMVDAGLTVIVTLISPFRADREAARSLFAAGQFIEVFVDTPLNECRRRDPKGLYARAATGEIAQFTGISSPYEPPLAPEFVLSTLIGAPETLIDPIMTRLQL